MRIGEEKKIQFNIVNWLRQCHPTIFFMANLNENDGTPMWRQISQKMGVISGVSDLFFPQSNEHYKGLWLELKTESGKGSESQINFCSHMISFGYDACITYGHDHAEHVIKKFYNLDK